MKHFIQLLAALVLVSVLTATANADWYPEELYSNADGSVQFILLDHFPVGTTLTVRNGSASHSLTIPDAFRGKPGVPYILVGTQGFADLGVIKPDFVVPDGFLFVPSGQIVVGPTNYNPSIGYYGLPTDGVNALFPYAEEETFRPAWATNSLGDPSAFAPFPPPRIGPGFTGVWYDPAQIGHGIFIEVLSENRLLAWWFTFNPAGTEQAWFGGVGTYDGNTPVNIPVYQATGGRWIPIPGYDTNRIVNSPWGTLTLTFTDCNHGKVDFNSVSGYGTGSMELTRLTQPAGLTCRP